MEHDVPVLEHDHLYPVRGVDVLANEVPEHHEDLHEEVEEVKPCVKVGDVLCVVELCHLSQHGQHHCHTAALSTETCCHFLREQQCGHCLLNYLLLLSVHNHTFIY